MKILSLELENLNSLRGRHSIRFDEPPLNQTGIFAIVGETGAGKTTLLDAITLALYGQIARENKSSGGGEQVMSYGTVHCFAQVEFSTPSGQYRCRWERRKAHKKLDGNLQAAEHSLDIFVPEKKAFENLSSKTTEVKELLPEVSGLSYDQFTRSALLPQGDFARFLKANENDKAALLEKITATSVYRQLGAAAFQYHKEAQQEVADLQNRQKELDLLDPESLAAIQAEKQATEAAIRANKKQIQQLRQQIQQQEKLQERLKEQQEKTKAYQAEQEKKNSQAAGRQALLQSKKLGKYRVDFASLDQVEKQAKEAQESLKNEQAKASELANKLEELAKKQQDCQEKHDKFQAEYPKRKIKIDEARKLEGQRYPQQQDVKILEADINKMEAEHQGILDKLKQDKAEQAQLQKQLASLWEKIQQVLRPTAKRESPGKEALLPSENLAPASSHPYSIPQESRNIQRARDEASAEKESQALQLQQIRLQDQINRLKDGVKELEKTYQKQQEEQQRLDKKRENAEKNQTFYTQNLEQYQQDILLADLKKGLSDGEPCPLCGASDHPALAHWSPPSQDLIEENIKKLEAAKTQLAALQTAITQGAAALAKTENSLERARQDAQDAHVEYQAKFASLPYPTADADTLEAAIKAHTLQLQKLAELSEQIAESEPQQAALEQVKESINKQLSLSEGLATQIAEKKLARQQKEQAVADLDQQLQALLHGLSVEEAEKKMTAIGEKSRKALEDALAEIQTHRTAIATTQEAIKRIGQTLEQAQTQAKQKRQILEKATQALGYNSLPEAHAHLLEVEKEEALAEQFQQTDLRIHTLEVQLQTLQKEVEELATITASLPGLEQLSASVKQIETQDDTQRQAIGRLVEKLANDAKNREKAQQLQAKLEAAKEILRRRAQLSDLIGSSDGTKFSKYAQGLTLNRLVHLANQQLQQLSDRYRIKQSEKKALELSVIDHYQADNERPMHTLSGGESFLVSLALALGLSDLAGGRIQIQSLFIDEGFGTLDNNALDMVVNALENLQARGKTIGLISHVAVLRERIQHQIVLKARGDGVSGLEVI